MADNQYHCRDCVYLCGRKTSVGIECTNTERRMINGRKSQTNRLKYPSCKACKSGFKLKEE